jgi:hypothetical protein
MKYTAKADPGVDESACTRTSRSSTPRTLTSIDGAFKGADYGGWLEHYPAKMDFTRLLLIGTAVLFIVIALVLLFF